MGQPRRWQDCTHSVGADHVVGRTDRGRRIWRCSGCGASGVWRRGWSYYGNVECRRCAQPVVAEVRCPACGAKEKA